MSIDFSKETLLLSGPVEVRTLWNKPKAGPELFVAQIDGHTFLSQSEVDAYYDQQAQQEYDNRGGN